MTEQISQKRPEAGEWWLDKCQDLCFVFEVPLSGGRLAAHDGSADYIEMIGEAGLIAHVPGCTGFDYDLPAAIVLQVREQLARV